MDLLNVFLVQILLLIRIKFSTEQSRLRWLVVAAKTPRISGGAVGN